MYKKILFILFLALSLSNLSVAQKGSDVCFEVNGKPITVEEFKYIYEKNNLGDEDLYSNEHFNEYLNLYINFKLKVNEAYNKGIDTYASFKNEYNKLRGDLAKPYLRDREVTEQLIKEAYERMQFEVRAKHILIPVSENASPKDTQIAYNKALAIKDSLKRNLASFEALAKRNSSDSYSAKLGGDLGYFTVFNMVYPFESGAYSLKDTMEVSNPVRSRFGYHLIKLTDKRKYRGEIKVQHIFFAVNEKDNAEKQALQAARADSVYNMLLKGEKFGKLVEKYTDHIATKNSEGVLSPFNSLSNYPEEFKDQSFSLKNDGDFSKPFLSTYGYHIVKRMEYFPLKSFKDLEGEIRRKVEKDSRSNLTKETTIARIKKDFEYIEISKNKKKIFKQIDTSLISQNFKQNFVKKHTNKPLVVIDSKKILASDFLKFLEKNQTTENYTDLNFALNSYFTRWSDEVSYNHYDYKLEEIYPDFKILTQEYKEGIMLFEITDKNVWSKAIEDTLGQKNFYEKNKNNYKWEDRAKTTIFTAKNKSIAQEIKNMLEKGDTAYAIAKSFQTKDALSVTYKQDVIEKGKDSLLNLTPFEKGIYLIPAKDDEYKVVYIQNTIPASLKELKEIKGILIADYQDYLEKEWIKELKNKYPVKKNESILNMMIKN